MGDSTIKRLNVKNYVPFAEDLEYEVKNTQKVLANLYKKNMNELNCNNFSKAQESLEEYRYVPNEYLLPEGKFVRWIQSKTKNNMFIRTGGFVLSDNGWSFTVKLAGRSKFTKGNIRKDGLYIFMLIDNNDRMYQITNTILKES